MARIYRRESLTENVQSRKRPYTRKRDQLINFRMTKEEKKLIETRIALSGLSKQEFFLQSCINQQIITVGNVKTFDAIRKDMRIIEEHLDKISRSDELDEVILMSLKTILEILDGFYKEREYSR